MEREVVRAVYVSHARKRCRELEAARDRPVDPAVVQQAAGLAARYTIDVTARSDGSVGTVEEFPSVLGHASSEAGAVEMTRELLTWTIAYLIESGRTPAPKA